MMFNILDFAKLSLHVYKDRVANNRYLSGYIKDDPISFDSLNVDKLKRSGVYEVIVNPAVQSLSAAKNNDFYASFYVRMFEGRAVAATIAIRGTTFGRAGNVIQDLKSWWHSFFDGQAIVNVPWDYLAKAQQFYYQVKAFVHRYMPISALKLFVVGHSLGGAIAALLTTRCGMPIRAVTFNAPGIKHVPGVRNYWHSVLNFRALTDFVSALDAPIGLGTDYFIADKRQPAEAAFQIARQHRQGGLSRLNVIADLIESIDFVVSVIAQHSMVNSLQELQSNEERSFIGLQTFDGFMKRASANFDRGNVLDSAFL